MTMIEKLRLKEEIDARNEEAIKKWSMMTHGQRYQLEVETHRIKILCIIAFMGFCLLISILDPILVSLCVS